MLREQAQNAGEWLAIAQVAELVADDVVQHPGAARAGGATENESVAARRARAPARALVAHRERLGSTPSAGAWRSIEASSAAARRAPVPALERLAAPGAIGCAQLERAGAPAGARALRRRRCAAEPPRRRATPRPAAPVRATAGCWRASARSSHGASVSSAPSIAVSRARAGTTSSGPTPGTSTSRTRRARDERRTRTFTAPLRRSTVRSPSTPGRLCAVRAEQITEPLALHGEGPCWLARSGEVAWVDMLAGRVLATSLAGGTTRVIDIPGPVAAMVRPRAGGGLVVASETGVALLDENDDSDAPVRGLRATPGIRMNEGGCDPQGRFWIGTMAYDCAPGPGSCTASSPMAASRRRSPAVTISNGLGWSPDGATAFYVDSTVPAIDTFAFDGANGELGERSASPRSSRASASPTASPSTPRAASGSRSGMAQPCFRYAPDGDARRRRAAAVRAGDRVRVRRRRTSRSCSSRRHGSSCPTASTAAGALFRCVPGVRGQAVNTFAG